MPAARKSSRAPRPPQVFISHRHGDKAIADVVRSWITAATAGRVRVFQSSDYAHGVKIGNPLSRELISALWHTDVLILIYTVADHDWSFCTWECGVAIDPASPDTRVVVFQFADEGPRVFDDLAKVRPRSREGILQFANQFLTDTSFFPRRIGPITGHYPQSPDVLAEAESLCTELSRIPATAHESIQEWPAWPFMKLRTTVENCELLAVKEYAIASQQILEETRVILLDKVALSVLGLPSLQGCPSLASLTTAFIARCGTRDKAWVASLTLQLHLAMRWEFTQVNWSLFKGRRAIPGEWFSPVVGWVRKIPYENCMEFDLYLLPFVEQDGAINIPLPSIDALDLPKEGS